MKAGIGGQALRHRSGGLVTGAHSFDLTTSHLLGMDLAYKDR